MIMAITYVFEYDMYERYIVCGKCNGYKWNHHNIESDGDLLLCEHCGQTSIIGVEYSDI